MSEKHQAVWLNTPKGLTDEEKEKLADAYIEYIYDRTVNDNNDKYGRAFPKYSKDYKRSLDFINAGKNPSDVNLTLSGDMLAELKLLKVKGNKVLIGYEKGSVENAKADGNIRGTYGTDTPKPNKARDFLGFEGKELDEKARIDATFKPKATKEAVANLSASYKRNRLIQAQERGEISRSLSIKNKDNDELEALYLKYFK